MVFKIKNRLKDFDYLDDDEIHQIFKYSQVLYSSYIYSRIY